MRQDSVNGYKQAYLKYFLNKTNSISTGFVTEVGNRSSCVSSETHVVTFNSINTIQFS